MKDLDDVKSVLKEIQVNFNPEKSTYKIIDSVINDSMSVDLMIKSLNGVKGIEKYPDDIKSKYFEVLAVLNEILLDEREKSYREEQEKKTKELKDIISSLEKRNNKKNSEEKVNSDEKVSLDKDIKEEVNDDKISEKKSDNKKELSLDKIVSKSISDDDSLDVDKSKKIFSCLLGLIAFCIMIGVLLIIFL